MSTTAAPPARRNSGAPFAICGAVCLALGLAACQRRDEVRHDPQRFASADSPTRGGNAVPDIPLGDVIGAAAIASADAASAAASQAIEAAPDERVASRATPPLDAHRVAAGKALFLKMNCASCHGYGGGGGMGPDLTDGYWRYGDSPVEVYRTLYDGRPQGMPSWGRALSSDELWSLVAYVESLAPRPGGGGPPILAAEVQPASRTREP